MQQLVIDKNLCRGRGVCLVCDMTMPGLQSYLSAKGSLIIGQSVGSDDLRRIEHLVDTCPDKAAILSEFEGSCE